MRPTSVLADAWQGLSRNKSIAISVVLVTMISMYLLGVGVLAQRVRVQDVPRPLPDVPEAVQRAADRLVGGQ